MPRIGCVQAFVVLLVYYKLKYTVCPDISFYEELATWLISYVPTYTYEFLYIKVLFNHPVYKLIFILKYVPT